MQRIPVASLLLSAAIAGAPSGALPQAPHTPQEARRLHQDSKAYIASLEDPKRDAWQRPEEVVNALELKEGEAVADVGAGSGYFAVRLAKAVGESGRVWAVDVDPAMVLYLNRRIRDAGAWNVRTVLAEPDDPLLADGSVDRFFVCDTWHHIEAQEKYLALMMKMLRPGGQVVMIDFQKKELPVGPPIHMKIAREDLIRQVEANGFRLAREHTFLPYQYFLVFAMR